eukprot:183292-Pleurochrysis_carterae.AAC.3
MRTLTVWVIGLAFAGEYFHWSAAGALARTVATSRPEDRAPLNTSMLPSVASHVDGKLASLLFSLQPRLIISRAIAVCPSYCELLFARVLLNTSA